MDELLEYVPEDKREAFKAKATGYVKLTDDVAFEYAKKSQSLTDRISTPVVEARFKNFETKELAARIEQARKDEREKTIKELKPEETPEAKRIRELEDKIAKSEQDKKFEQKRAALRDKASKAGYDPLVAERLYALEDADDVLDILAKANKARADEIEQLKKQHTYGANPPKGGSTSTTPELDAMRRQYVELQNSGRGAEAMQVYLRIQMKEKELQNG